MPIFKIQLTSTLTLVELEGILVLGVAELKRKKAVRLY